MVATPGGPISLLLSGRGAIPQNQSRIVADVLVGVSFSPSSSLSSSSGATTSDMPKFSTRSSPFRSSSGWFSAPRGLPETRGRLSQVR